MSSTSYGQLSSPGTSIHHDFRRPSASFSSYDHFSRRRSSSPGQFTRRPAYDSYKPRTYYDDSPNSYRPNVYRPGPERYYSRSPSPPRYDRPRQHDSRQWDHASRWPHKRSPSPPPWDKNRRDTLAERMFEPHEAWKQPHFDRPARYESPDTSVERYGDRRPQPPRDISPQRPNPRSEFTPHYDSYRPSPSFHAVRDLGTFSRTADTYRPQYSDDHWAPSHAVDGVNNQRRSSYYDRTDERQESSISSTPPRPPASLPKSLHRSLSPRPLAEAEDCRTSPSRFSTADGCRQSLSSSLSRSRGSSVLREGPDTRSESRSSSRSPRCSRTGISEHSTLPQLSIQPVLEKAPKYTHDSNAPLEGSESMGIVMHVPADKQSSSHETIYTNGNFAVNSEAFEGDAPRLLVPEAVSSIDATPQRDTSHEIVTPYVANSLAADSLRPLLKGSSSKTNRSAAAELPTSKEHATVDTAPPSLEANGCRKALPSLTRPATCVVHVAEKGSEIVPPGSDIGHTNAITTPEPVSNSLKIVVSDHSSIPAPPVNLYRSDDSKLTREGVRVVLLTRLLYDRQSRTERVFPVIRANQVASSLNLPPPANPNRRSEELLSTSSPGRLAAHEAIRSSLVDRFVERQSEIVEKSRRLKTEYMALHERWLEHCARLDDIQKTGTPEESAVPSGGRTTRRSTAVMGDAVRSDLEMEQIIASLGVEELTDPSYLAIRNVARIPDMISVTEGSVPFLFDDTNNIVDDPSDFYGASSGQDYWTEEERDIFLNEFAAHPKQFGLIAQRLPNKTAAQCVTYYYLNKKQGVDFRKAVMQYGTSRRRKNGRASKQRGNALLADIRRHDDEVSRLSPISLNEPASSTGNKRKRGVDRSNGESRRSSTSRRAITHAEATSSGTTPDPDAEQPRRRRRTAISTRAVAVITADEVVNDNAVGCPVPA